MHLILAGNKLVFQLGSFGNRLINIYNIDSILTPKRLTDNFFTNNSDSMNTKNHYLSKKIKRHKLICIEWE